MKIRKLLEEFYGSMEYDENLQGRIEALLTKHNFPPAVAKGFSAGFLNKLKTTKAKDGALWIDKIKEIKSPDDISISYDEKAKSINFLTRSDDGTAAETWKFPVPEQYLNKNQSVVTKNVQPEKAVPAQKVTSAVMAPTGTYNKVKGTVPTGIVRG